MTDNRWDTLREFHAKAFSTTHGWHAADEALASLKADYEALTQNPAFQEGRKRGRDSRDRKREAMKAERDEARAELERIEAKYAKADENVDLLVQGINDEIARRERIEGERDALLKQLDDEFDMGHTTEGAEP